MAISLAHAVLYYVGLQSLNRYLYLNKYGALRLRVIAMLFRFEEIGDGGLFFEVSRNRRWLTNITEIAENKCGMKLLSDIFVSANIQKMSGHICVLGKLSFDLISPCSRCLKSVQVGVDRQVNFTFPTTGREGVIDISDDMREEVAMAMPERVICNSKCKGLCPGCGTDLNDKVCICKKEETDTRFEVLKQFAPSY